MTKDEKYSEQETAKRRDAALQRMLATPHQPHKPLKRNRAKKAKPSR
jgi:hypothetical protein